jgi:hypothetical protein
MIAAISAYGEDDTGPLEYGMIYGKLSLQNTGKRLEYV